MKHQPSLDDSGGDLMAPLLLSLFLVPLNLLVLLCRATGEEFERLLKAPGAQPWTSDTIKKELKIIQHRSERINTIAAQLAKVHHLSQFLLPEALKGKEALKQRCAHSGCSALHCCRISRAIKTIVPG